VPKELQMAAINTNTFIRDSSGHTIVNREGFYELKNHRARFSKRPTITDKGETITAENIQFDDSTGASIATGNAVFRDTVQGLTLISNFMLAPETNSFRLHKALIILKRTRTHLYTDDTVFLPIFGFCIEQTGLHSEHSHYPDAKNQNDSGLRYLRPSHVVFF
jgi:hypothetical protein